MNIDIYILSILFVLNTLTGCKGDDNIPPTEPPIEGVDRSTTCTNVQDNGIYRTFYQPLQGYVGDPMRYYNAGDNKFYLFYLYENANRHTIYITITNDFRTFEGFTQILPAGPICSQDEWIRTPSFIKKDHTYYRFYTGHNDNLNPA